MPVRDYVLAEGRFAMLARSDPERADRLFALAQADVNERWRYYEQLAGMERTIPHGPTAPEEATDDAKEGKAAQ